MKIGTEKIIPILIFVFCGLTSSAQLQKIPLVLKSSQAKKNSASPRTKQPNPDTLKLPFWDDFSFNNPAHADTLEKFPGNSIWQFGRSVWVNPGMGINPPTINVATFDGLDSLGLPYDLANPFKRNVADRLTSQPIRMDLVDQALRPSIFIFFQYQFQGNGDAPQAGDDLSLWFKNRSGKWNKVWSAGPEDAATVTDNTVFTPVTVYINDAQYFHKGFQFRFQNFGNVAGPFDTWNLDYVYINNGQSQMQPVFKDFPDRAIATPLSSIFLQYYSMPIKHFLSNANAQLAPSPSLVVTNQRQDQKSAAPQPVTLSAKLTVATRTGGKNGAVTRQAPISYATTAAQPVAYGTPQTFALTNTMDFSKINSTVDSIAVQVHTWITTKDGISKAGLTAGDFDPRVYQGIDFRHNDTTHTNFSLTNYYAYDDGVAEYAATLTQSGGILAYQFNMVTPMADTLTAIDIYFPHVADESSQIVTLGVWKTLTNNNKMGLQQQDLVVQRTANNIFTRVPLSQALLVKDTFYIGYKQNSGAQIGVGLDMSNKNSEGKIFYNSSGLWKKNTMVTGNLMIRPVFGKGTIITTGIEEKISNVYPNPNRGVFNLPAGVQNLQVIDVTGKTISFTKEDFMNNSQVTLTDPSAGIYILRYFNNTQWCVEKVMVLP